MFVKYLIFTQNLTLCSNSFELYNYYNMYQHLCGTKTLEDIQRLFTRNVFTFGKNTSKLVRNFNCAASTWTWIDAQSWKKCISSSHFRRTWKVALDHQSHCRPSALISSGAFYHFLIFWTEILISWILSRPLLHPHYCCCCSRKMNLMSQNPISSLNAAKNNINATVSFQQQFP